MLNIHPAIVHFPIALLTLYSILECIRTKKFLQQQYWFYLKAVFVIVGTLGAFASLETGEMVGERGPLVEMHANFASVTTFIYVLLSASYLIAWIKKDAASWVWLSRPLISKIWNFKIQMSNFFLKPLVSVSLALVGLLLLTVTGALGGAIAYGPDIDPLVSFVYHLFF